MSMTATVKAYMHGSLYKSVPTHNTFNLQTSVGMPTQHVPDLFERVGFLQGLLITTSRFACEGSIRLFLCNGRSDLSGTLYIYGAKQDLANAIYEHLHFIADHAKDVARSYPGRYEIVGDLTQTIKFRKRR